MPIFRNDVTILGNIVKLKRFDKANVTRVSVEVPFTKRDGDRGSHTIEVDAKGDKGKELADQAKEGGSIFIKGVMTKRKYTPSSKPDKQYSIVCVQMDDFKGFRFTESKVHDGYSEVLYAGRVMQTPELHGSGDSARTNVNVVYNRPGTKKDDEEKGTFIDVGVWGASAEKYVCKYVKEGDFVLVEGSLNPVKEKEKAVVGEKEVEIWGLRLNAARFAGVQAITPGAKGGGGGSSGVSKADDSIYDDDLPF
jgi:single-stranded DNA-binding protein